MIPLGLIAPSQGALDALAAAGTSLTTLLVRHQKGDAGELDPRDAGIVDAECFTDGKVNSIYLLGTGDAIWITTEGDRSVTTALVVPRAYLEEFGSGF